MVDTTTIKKYTRDKSYSKRLLSQAVKQMDFRSANEVPMVTAPDVRRIDWTPSECSVYMDFLNASDYIQFLGTGSREHVAWLVDKLIRVVTQAQAQSSVERVGFSVVERKFESVVRGLAMARQDLVESVFNRFPKEDMVLPTGACHGDLTLSNVLVKGETLVLIDFLDTFLETPLQDMVKLRQDTSFRWSNSMYSQPFDRTRIDIVMDHMDAALDKYFRQFEYYRRYYNLFQFMNLARILPYVRDAAVEDGVCAAISTLGAQI